jgi:predicted RND superfamily exporter protein
MGLSDRLAGGITRHSKVVIVVLLVASLAIGAGASMVEQSSSIDSFQSDDSPEAQAQSYVAENFSAGSDNTSLTQVIVRGDNTLSKDSLLEQLALQAAYRDNETINASLVDDTPTAGVANILASAAISRERRAALAEEAAALQNRTQELNASADRVVAAINESRAIQSNASALNTSFANGEITYANYSAQMAALEARSEALRENVTAGLTPAQAANATDLLNRSRTLTRQFAALNRSVAAGSINESVYENRSARIEAGFERIAASVGGPQAGGASTNESARPSNASAGTNRSGLIGAVNETRALQREYDRLNRSRANESIGPVVYFSRSASIEGDLGEVRERATANLSENRTRQVERALSRARTLQAQQDRLRAAFESGEIDEETYRQRREEIAAGFEQLYAQLSSAPGAGGASGASPLSAAIERTRSLQSNYSALNRSLAYGAIGRAAYEENASRLSERLAAIETNATASLGPNRTAEVEALLNEVRSLQRQQDRLDALYAAEGIDRSTYRERATELGNRTGALYRGVQGVFAEQFEEVADRGEALQENRSALQNATSTPSLAAQREQIESMNASAIDGTIDLVLGENASDGSGGAAFSFMPTGYDPGSTDANATMIVATHATGGGGGGATTGSAGDQLVNAELAMQDVAADVLDGGTEALVFGGGVLSDEITRSMTDSILIVGPLALLFVLVVLIVAYRDLLDIALGVVGIGLVLLWTFGFMGWARIAFNQIFIAVPVLLIGLSIDYAIHVFMRHREERERTEGVDDSMTTALGSVGVALALVTATAVIGFLSNLVSSLPPIREFGIVNAVGITAALVIFGALIPALKVEIDTFLEGRGWDRQKRAFGTGGGVLGSLLSGGATAARKAPWVVIALALVLTVAGGVGASQVDTSFSQADFIADDPPDWTESLPEPFAPSEYSAKDALNYVNSNFLVETSSADLLLRGDVTSPQALERVERGVANASNADTTVVLASGEPDVTGPLSTFESVAATNESFNATLAAADTDGDGVPDRNVGGVYDALYEVAPQQAESVLYRTEAGEYEALHLSVSVEGSASGDAVTEDMRGVATAIEGGGVTAIATGQPIVFKIVQDQLLNSVIESLLITLLATFVFLMVTYRWLHGSATLGFITLLPVAFSVTWILGTMYLLEIPFNVITGLITSLSVGLGIAYSIHLSERFSHELGHSGDVWEAMHTAVTGTGGALLGSAATTIGGFGVLVFAILPPLQQFGIITGLTILYAFLGSVLVLPSLLAIWTRYLGPDDVSATARSSAEGEGTPATDD